MYVFYVLPDVEYVFFLFRISIARISMFLSKVLPDVEYVLPDVEYVFFLFRISIARISMFSFFLE